jgi:uncharacterized protein (TIGR00369 family)
MFRAASQRPLQHGWRHCIRSHSLRENGKADLLRGERVDEGGGLNRKRARTTLVAGISGNLQPGVRPSILSMWHGGCRIRLPFQGRSLRSGPTIMMLADVAMYAALLASIGWESLAATTSLNINFLRRSGALAMEAECRLLKLGKRLAVGEVAIRSEGEDELVAHATSTYSISAGPNG